VTPAELGAVLRRTGSLPEELRRAVLTSPPEVAVEVAACSYWFEAAVALILERGPETVPAIHARAVASLGQPRPFEGSILLWSLRQLTGAPPPPAYDPLLGQELGSSAPAEVIHEAQSTLLRELPVDRREALVLAGWEPRWPYLATCPTLRVAEAAVVGLAKHPGASGNSLAAVAGAAAMGRILSAPLRRALDAGQPGNRVVWTAALAKVGDPEARSTLSALLADPDRDVRAWARAGLVRTLTPPTLDLHAALERCYRRGAAGEPWEGPWRDFFEELDQRGIPLLTAAEHLSERVLAEHDRPRSGPRPYGSGSALTVVLVRMGLAAVPVWRAHLLRLPPDADARQWLRDPAHVQIPGFAEAKATSLAEVLGSTEVGCHDAVSFDWLACDAPRVEQARTAMQRGLDHPDARVRAVCRWALGGAGVTLPDDPFTALPALIADVVRFCEWGALECRVLDRRTGTLHVHSSQLESPPPRPQWAPRPAADDSLRSVLTATDAALAVEDPALKPITWEQARAVLDGVFENERGVGLGSEIAAALDPLFAALAALDTQPSGSDGSVYRVAWDAGFAFDGPRYRGCLWYLNDQ
jgi:hypothetical protein